MEKNTSQTHAGDKAYKTVAIITASGSGTRFGDEMPKQYKSLCGKTILEHSVQKFIKSEWIDEIYIVIHPDHQDYYKQTLEHLNLNAPVIGSKESRSISVYNCLQSIPNINDEDILIIHDAVRPLFDVRKIKGLIGKASLSGAATYATPVTDTLKRQGADYVDRKDLWRIQTPQAFQYKVLQDAYNKTDNIETFSDETSLVHHTGYDIDFVNSGSNNIKITFPEDLELARNIMNLNKKIQTRTGLGFDVHAFDTDQNGPIRLGGIDIDFDKKLSGHSDADVVLHALTDAILGALSLGDIGTHFPPSDQQWKNQDSALFVEKAVDLMREHKAELVNADITIMCEKPKIGPYAGQMRQRIADICEVSLDQISVKATTTEKLGFTGREEGIACQAIVSLEVIK